MVQLDRKQMVIIIALAAVILFGGGYRMAQLSERPAVENRPALEAEAEGKARELLVHVAGAVASPGVYQLRSGSRVIDAVNMAGPLPEANLNALKLASPVADGQSILVPLQPAQAPAGPQAGAATSAGGAGRNVFSAAAGPAPAGSGAGQVNINTADQAQLDTLPGIGPALAQRIIQYREVNGPFQSADDLKNVSGIGDKKFEQLKDLVTVW